MAKLSEATHYRNFGYRARLVVLLVVEVFAIWGLSGCTPPTSSHHAASHALALQELSELGLCVPDGARILAHEAERNYDRWLLRSAGRITFPEDANLLQVGGDNPSLFTYAMTRDDRRQYESDVPADVAQTMVSWSNDVYECRATIVRGSCSEYAAIERSPRRIVYRRTEVPHEVHVESLQQIGVYISDGAEILLDDESDDRATWVVRSSQQIGFPLDATRVQLKKGAPFGVISELLSMELRGQFRRDISSDALRTELHWHADDAECRAILIEGDEIVYALIQLFGRG